MIDVGDLFILLIYFIIVCGLAALGAFAADWLEKHFPRGF